MKTAAEVAFEVWGEGVGFHAGEGPAVREMMVAAIEADRAQREARTLDVVFDGPPAHESGRFVEVENLDGASVNAGEWIDRGDGYWALRIEAGQPVQTFADPVDEVDLSTFDGLFPGTREALDHLSLGKGATATPDHEAAKAEFQGGFSNPLSAAILDALSDRQSDLAAEWLSENEDQAWLLFIGPMLDQIEGSITE